MPTAARYIEPAQGNVIAPKDILDLSKQLKPDGTLDWNVPAGNWTVVRMGRRVSGAGTRPAPEPALGLESDKLDAKALEFHLEQYVGKLLGRIGKRAPKHGLTTLHMDSWESGAQNWTPLLLDEFRKRRGYDARPWLLTYTGRAVQSLEMSERFLWDLRLTCQELVLENHAGAVKNYGRMHGLSLSIEPYDMNPSGDLDLGAVADVPMAEFWSNSVDSTYSVFESTSIAHVMGKPIVSAEAFTAQGGLDAYPWSLKNQGDWAFAAGISCVSQARVAFWHDDRETPDTWTSSFVFEKKNCTVTYEGSMASNRGQSPEYMGNKGRIVYNSIGQNATMFETFKDDVCHRIARHPRAELTSFFAPTKEHRRPDHMEEFFNSVRTRQKTRCNEDEAFIETAVLVMATEAYKQKREVRWDAEKEWIV